MKLAKPFFNLLLLAFCQVAFAYNINITPIKSFPNTVYVGVPFESTFSVTTNAPSTTPIVFSIHDDHTGSIQVDGNSECMQAPRAKNPCVLRLTLLAQQQSEIAGATLHAYAGAPPGMQVYLPSPIYIVPAPTFTITPSASAGGSISPATAQTVTYGGGATFTMSPSTGYHIANVLVDGASVGTPTSYPFTNVTANHTIAASFAQDEYTLTTTSSPSQGGTVNKDRSGTYHYGEVATVTEVTNPGWTFTGWSGACTGTGSCQVTMTSNNSVTANFTQNGYVLTTNVVGQGTISNNPLPPYHLNDKVTLTANPAAGWTFASWSGACSGSGACTVTMDAAKTVTATFTPNEYKLTTNVVGRGTIDKNPQPPYHLNDQVTLTPTASIGWAFSNWSGACSGSGACTVTMDAAKTVTANFKPTAEYTVTIINPDHATITKSPDQATYHYGDTVTLAAAGIDNWSFYAWQGDYTGTDNPHDFTVTGNMTVSAKIINGSVKPYNDEVHLQYRGLLVHSPAIYGKYGLIIIAPPTIKIDGVQASDVDKVIHYCAKNDSQCGTHVSTCDIGYVLPRDNQCVLWFKAKQFEPLGITKRSGTISLPVHMRDGEVADLTLTANVQYEQSVYLAGLINNPSKSAKASVACNLCKLDSDNNLTALYFNADPNHAGYSLAVWDGDLLMGTKSNSDGNLLGWNGLSPTNVKTLTGSFISNLLTWQRKDAPVVLYAAGDTAEYSATPYTPASYLAVTGLQSNTAITSNMSVFTRGTGDAVCFAVREKDQLESYIGCFNQDQRDRGTEILSRFSLPAATDLQSINSLYSGDVPFTSEKSLCAIVPVNGQQTVECYTNTKQAFSNWGDGLPGRAMTSLANINGKLCTYVYGQGYYCRDANSWEQEFSASGSYLTNPVTVAAFNGAWYFGGANTTTDDKSSSSMAAIDEYTQAGGWQTLIKSAGEVNKLLVVPSLVIKN